LVWNAADSGFMNNSELEVQIPAFLEILGLAFVGHGSRGLAQISDKQMQYLLAAEMGIPTPKSKLVDDDAKLLEHGLNYPVFIKPNNTDSSLGIDQLNVAFNGEQLKKALEEGIRKNYSLKCPVIVQEYLSGPEFVCTIIGNKGSGYTQLPIGRINFPTRNTSKTKHAIRTFAMKNTNESYSDEVVVGEEFLVPLTNDSLSDENQQIIYEGTRKLFERLNGADYCRADWRLDANNSVPKLLEVNTNPYVGYDSSVVKVASFANVDYSTMLEMIAQAAIARYSRTKT